MDSWLEWLEVLVLGGAAFEVVRRRRRFLRETRRPRKFRIRKSGRTSGAGRRCPPVSRSTSSSARTAATSSCRHRAPWPRWQGGVAGGWLEKRFVLTVPTHHEADWVREGLEHWGARAEKP